MASQRVPLGRLLHRGLLTLAGTCLLLTGMVVPTGAQTGPEVRILTVVDYLAGNEVYLAAGTEHGLRVGDSLSVYDGEDEGAELLGLLSIQSATERRSVATFVGQPFSIQRADLLYLGLPESLARARALEFQGAEQSAAAIPEENPAEPGSEPNPTPQTDPRPPVRMNGRISFDIDALQTTTRWGDSPEEEAKRTFSTPTLRFQARAQDLPGGFRLGTSMRLSHRTSPDNSIQPETSTRFYQLDLEKRFEAIPLQLHLGRFHNSYDDYSGYWDGLMVHYGDQGLGGGFAVGFEPNLWNEGISSDLPKASGFIDYNAQGETVAYSGAASFTALRPSNGLPDKSTLGISQRLSLGNAWIRQRASVDRSVTSGEWILSRIQLDASIPLGEGLSAFGGWRRWRSPYAVYPVTIDAPRHDRASAGLSAALTARNLGLNLAVLERENVGGGDSAVEANLALAEQQGNEVRIAFRGESFSRAKPRNRDRLEEASRDGRISVLWSTQIIENGLDRVQLRGPNEQDLTLPNNRLSVFAGGELPTLFLERCGVKVDTKFGER